MALQDRFDELHETAASISGRSDFGDTDYIAPMRMLLADYDASNELSGPEEAAIAGDVIGALVGRLFAIDGFKVNAVPVSPTIRRPLFIVGMPRSGTTALHRLLTMDEANQSIPFWLATTPMPRPPRGTWEANPWYRMAADALKAFYAASPAMLDIHPIRADQADECRIVLQQTFFAASMASTHRTSAYADWCLTSDGSYAYRHYRRAMSLVAAGDDRQMVLKCPTHVWSLDALLNVFPDAGIIFTHREITTAMTSVASLVEAVRRGRGGAPDRPALAAEQLRNYGRALDKSERIRRGNDPARFFDVDARRMRSDPLGTVTAIYEHFGIPLSDQRRKVLERAATADPAMGHGQHVYDPADFDLSDDKVLAGVGAYAERLRSLDLIR